MLVGLKKWLFVVFAVSLGFSYTDQAMFTTLRQVHTQANSKREILESLIFS